MIIFTALRIIGIFAPIYVIVNNYCESFWFAFIVTLVAGFIYNVLINLNFISVVAFFTAWIWGGVIMVKHAPLVFTIIYVLLFLINLYLWFVGSLLIKYRSGQLRPPVNTDDQETDESE